MLQQFYICLELKRDGNDKVFLEKFLGKLGIEERNPEKLLKILQETESQKLSDAFNALLPVNYN